MKEKKQLTKRNKTIIAINYALGIFSVVMAIFAYSAPDGPPLILLVVWLGGMLLYSGINYLEQQMDLTRKLMMVRQIAVLSVIFSGLGFMAT